MALNNSQYDALMRVYQKRQRDDRHRQEERIAEVYRALPQMERYDREISALSVERAKKLLDGDERGAAQCMRQLEELREERGGPVFHGRLSGGLYGDGLYLSPVPRYRLCERPESAAASARLRSASFTASPTWRRFSSGKTSRPSPSTTMIKI